MTAPRITFEPATAAIWTPKRLVIVSAGTPLDAAAKIHFVVSGLACCGATGLDARSIATKAIEAGGSFKNIAERLREEIEGPLADAAQLIHDNSPEDFKRHLSGKNATEIIIFGVADGEMQLAHIGFKTKKRGKEAVFQSLQKDYPNAGTDIMSVELITAGVDGAVDAAFRKSVTGQQALVYPEESLQRFIALALAERTPHIFKLSV